MTEERISELLEISHGQFATIDYHNMNDKFYKKLKENGISIDEFSSAYRYISGYLSEGYNDNKEESDNDYIDYVVDTIKIIINYANVVAGYKDMGEINLVISQEDFHLENEGANLGYEMDSIKGEKKA